MAEGVDEAVLDPIMVSVSDAKSNLSELGNRAANGEVFVVTKFGKPHFRIVGLEPELPPRVPGGNYLGITSVSDAPLGEG